MSERIIVHIEVKQQIEVLGLAHLSDDELLRHLIEVVSPADVLDGAKWRVSRQEARPSLDALVDALRAAARGDGGGS